jgi:hypothetical protein
MTIKQKGDNHNFLKVCFQLKTNYVKILRMNYFKIKMIKIMKNNLDENKKQIKDIQLVQLVFLKRREIVIKERIKIKEN